MSVKFNYLTMTYDAQDGTRVAAEIVDSAQCLADVLRVAQIRAEQRSAKPQAQLNSATTMETGNGH